MRRAHTKRPPRPRLAKRIAAGAASALAAAGAIFYGCASEPHDALGIVAELHNVREVDPGRFYRSAQLSPETLDEVIDAFGIRSVINLRGYGDADWRDAESAVTRESAVPLYDVHLSARSLPRREQLLRLLGLYRVAARPLLVHCQGGADRTGEAAALYAIEYMGRTTEQALEMLTLRYRHLEWLRPAKRAFVSAYRGERWVRERYDPCAPEWGDLQRPGICDALRPTETARR